MSESIPELLTRIAQNDYMIDQHFLPDGQALLDAAERIRELEADPRLNLTLPDVTVGLSAATLVATLTSPMELVLASPAVGTVTRFRKIAIMLADEREKELRE